MCSNPTFGRSMRQLALVLAGVAGLGLGACGGGSSDQSKQFEQRVTASQLGIMSTRLEENSGHVHINGSQQFVLTGVDRAGETVDLSNKTIWRISDASLGGIDRNGLFTPAGKTGEFTLTAAFADQTHTQAVIVSNPNLVGITVNAATDVVEVCRTAGFSAEALFDNGLVLAYPLTWRVLANIELANFPDASRPLLQTYKNGVVDVVAEGKDNDNLTVQSPPFPFTVADSLVSLALTTNRNVDSVTLREGQGIDIIATATYAGGDTAVITSTAFLSVSSTTAATIDPATGRLSARAGSHAGTPVTVTGRCDDQEAQLVVTIIKPDIRSIEIRNSSNNTQSVAITEGSSTTLSVTATYEDEAGTDSNYSHQLEWSIDETESDSFNSDRIRISAEGVLSADGDLNLTQSIRLVISARVTDTAGNTRVNRAGEELWDTITASVNPVN